MPAHVRPCHQLVDYSIILRTYVLGALSGDHGPFLGKTYHVTLHGPTRLRSFSRQIYFQLLSSPSFLFPFLPFLFMFAQLRFCDQAEAPY